MDWGLVVFLSIFLVFVTWGITRDYYRGKIGQLEKIKKGWQDMFSVHEYIGQEWGASNGVHSMRSALEAIRGEFPDIRDLHNLASKLRDNRFDLQHLRGEIERLQKSRKVKEFEALQKQLSETKCRVSTAEGRLQKIREALG